MRRTCRIGPYGECLSACGFFRANRAPAPERAASASFHPLGVHEYAFGVKSCRIRLAPTQSARLAGAKEATLATSGARRVGPSPLKGAVGLAPARAWRSSRRLHPRLASPCGVGGYASWPGLRPAAKAPNRRPPPRSARHAVAFPAPRELSCAFGLDKSDSQRLVKRRRPGGARKYASEGRVTHERKVRSVGGKRRHVRSQRY